MALGMFAFAVASLVSIFSGVTLEIAILRGGIAFLIFSVFGWLMAYLIYEEKKPETEKGKPEKEKVVKVQEETVSTPVESAAGAADTVAVPATIGSTTGDLDSQGLEAPDDSDF